MLTPRLVVPGGADPNWFPVADTEGTDGEVREMWVGCLAVKKPW